MTNIPNTPEEWQTAVDAAAGLRAIHDCKLYGLLQGGPAIDVAQCDRIQKAGQQRGYHPSRPAQELALEYIFEFNAGITTQ